ncbi:MAG: hypothetical protein K9K35_11895 [Rhodoferax sp.]|nr:hypothetical protein [Rhodoferax sp.]
MSIRTIWLVVVTVALCWPFWLIDLVRRAQGAWGEGDMNITELLVELDYHPNQLTVLAAAELRRQYQEIYTAYIEAANQTLRPQDERIALAFARAIIDATIDKLAQGVSVEPDHVIHATDSETIDCYREDQLTTAIAAARVQALEEAALVAGGLYQHYRDLYKGRATPVDKEHWYNPHTDGIADGAGMAEDAIRALIGETK